MRNRLLMLAALALVASSASAQSVGRSPAVPQAPGPQSLSRLTVQPPAQPQSAPVRAPTITPGGASALSPAARAMAVQQLTGSSTPPALAQTIRLAVNAPTGANSAALAFNNPAQVDSRSNMAVFLQADGWLDIYAPYWPTGLTLIDCAISSSPGAKFKYVAGSEATPNTNVGGEVPLVEGHMIFVVTMPSGGIVSISRSVVPGQSGAGMWGVQWCDITRIVG